MSVPKIVVHTDVFIEHLIGGRGPSMLRQAMGKFFCYATVFQAIELFSLAKSDMEFAAVEDSMSAMKLLGLNPRNARKYGLLLATHARLNRWNILIAGLCLESRLPILTNRARDFRGVKGLTIVPTKLIPQYESGEAILQAARR